MDFGGQGLCPSLNMQFVAHTTPICSLGFDNSATKLASGGSDGTLKIWKIRPKMRAYILQNPEHGPLNSVCFSPCGSFVATASGPTVRLWTPELKSECSTFRAHLSTVHSVDVSPDSKQLVTGSADKTVKVWNVRPQRFLHSLTGHQNWVRCVKFSRSDDSLVVSCGDDKVVKLWDSRTKLCIHSFVGHKDSVHSVDFDCTGKCIASSAKDSSVRLWDVRNHMMVQQYNVEDVQGISCNPEKKLLAAACKDGTVKILDICEGRLAFTLHGHQTSVQDVSFSASHLASGDSQGKIFLWKMPHGSSNSEATEEGEETKTTDVEAQNHDENGYSHSATVLNHHGTEGSKEALSSQTQNVAELLNRIVDQLETLTETVSTFDTRLSILESKFENVFKKVTMDS